VQLFLDTQPLEVINNKDNNGYTAFHKAILYNRPEIANLLSNHRLSYAIEDTHVDMDYNQDTRSSNHFVGYIAAQTLTPGISYVTDLVNGKNQDITLYDYYSNYLASYPELIFHAVISNIMFQHSYHYADLSLCNSMIASKLASDFATSMEIHATYTYPYINVTDINPQIYATEMLAYLGKVSASIIVGKYFNDGEDIGASILINITPALIDLGASIIYQGAVKINDELTYLYDNALELLGYDIGDQVVEL
jgi:hypothetical protein